MCNKILSISVAAYNLEELIEDNLKSFCASNVNNLLEVIVTDDGSKDGTSDIVQKYVDLYPNTIKLIKQENQGAGSTVNSGIKNATGKYFKMIDGDDWVETENLNKLIKYLSDVDVDMVITNHEVYDESKKRITSKITFDNIETNKIQSFSAICKNLHLDMHDVIYRTEILKENQIILDNGFYTDVEYLLLPIPFIKTVIYYNLDIYVYRIAREGQSVSMSSMQKHIDMHNLVLSRLIKYYEDNKENLDNNKKDYMSNRLKDMADVQLKTMLTFKIDNEQKENIKKYFVWLQKNNMDIFNKFKKGKKEQLLLRSNFKFTKLVSKIVIKDFNK